MGNGCPFHFCTVSSKGICQPLLFSLIRNELVSSHHSSYEGMDVRIDFGTTFLRKMYKTFICLKSQGLHPGYLSRFIAKSGCIHIMLNCIAGKHNVPNINLCLQGTCYSCIYHTCYTIYICQNLGTHSCIDLTDSGTDHHYLFPLQLSFIKVHGSPCLHLYICQLRLNHSHFLVHGSNNS